MHKSAVLLAACVLHISCSFLDHQVSQKQATDIAQINHLTAGLEASRAFANVLLAFSRPAAGSHTFHVVSLSSSPTASVHRLCANWPCGSSTERCQSLVCCIAKDSWTAEEDAALFAEVPAFTVGKGSNTVTFWSALARSSRTLSRRSPAECEERITFLSTATRTSTEHCIAYGPQPGVLVNWRRLGDGMYVGVLDGSNVWLTIEIEGRLQSDPGSGPGYVEVVGGRVLELGMCQSIPPGEVVRHSKPNSLKAFTDDLAAQLGIASGLGLAATCGLGFLLGSQGFGTNELAFSRQVPAVVQTRQITAVDQKTTAAQLTPVQVSLTTSEWAQRAQLQLLDDRAQLRLLESSAEIYGKLDKYEIRLLKLQRALDADRRGELSYNQYQDIDEIFRDARAAQAMLRPEVEEAKNVIIARLQSNNDRLPEVSKSASTLIADQPVSSSDMAQRSRFRFDNMAPRKGPYRIRTLGASNLQDQVAKRESSVLNLAITKQKAFDEGIEPCKVQLDLQLKWAQQNLAELKRVLAERGPNSAPVVLGISEEAIFPS